MDANITRIENTCKNIAIDFCTSCNPCMTCEACNNFVVAEFEWRTINRSNEFFAYGNKNGGYSTCMRDGQKIVSLKIDTVSESRHIRTRLRKKLELLFGNDDCCGECCPIKVFFTDGDSIEYFFTAKVGSTTTTDNFRDTIIMTQFAGTLEVCNNTFYGVDAVQVCGELGKVCGFKTPYTGCTKIEGKLLTNYRGNNCGLIKAIIQADGLVSPTLYNLTTGAYYGFDGTYYGELLIDSTNGVTYNGKFLSPTATKKGSNPSGLSLKYGVNEFALLAGGGKGTYCIEYGKNDWT